MTAFEAVQLADGRRLEYRVSGPADGLALVFHHGTPGAGTPVGVLDRAAHDRGLRLISPTRAGYGGSSRAAGRSVADVVGDTAALLEQLGVSRCVVAGWSGGGPHALACAARLDGVRGALVISGTAPYGASGLDWLSGMGEDNVVEFAAAADGEAKLRALLDQYWAPMKDISAEGIVASIGSLLPDVDRAVLTDEFGADLAAGFHEALRDGVDGWLDDDLAFVRDWGFELSEIERPVMIWQGSEDLMVPFAHGEWLAANVPLTRAHLEKGEGHLSIGVGAIGRMLDELVVVASST